MLCSKLVIIILLNYNIYIYMRYTYITEERVFAQILLENLKIILIPQQRKKRYSCRCCKEICNHNCNNDR